ncbi:MAG: hypothetical protein ACT4PT_12975, partial [Methanobacteriota archaeon]
VPAENATGAPDPNTTGAVPQQVSPNATSAREANETGAPQGGGAPAENDTTEAAGPTGPEPEAETGDAGAATPGLTEDGSPTSEPLQTTAAGDHPRADGEGETDVVILPPPAGEGDVPRDNETPPGGLFLVLLAAVSLSAIRRAWSR